MGEVELSFEDAFGPLGPDHPAFIGRVLFADYIAYGQTVVISDDDPDDLVMAFAYSQWGLTYHALSYDPTRLEYSVSNTLYLTPLFVVVGSWL